MAQNDRVRIAFIGAGGICRTRHLPNLGEIPEAEVITVCNRTRRSAEKVAGQFKIPGVETDWQAVLHRKDVDAVFIGTWPYTHAEMTIAALEAGKHVFCQARMAMDLDQARQMVAAADAHPSQVSMLCPPPHRMPWEPYIKRHVADGTLGELREVRIESVSDANLGSLTWRERSERSGRQMLQVGIWAETLNAFLGDFEWLSAQLDTPVTSKPDPENDNADYTIRIPQVVHLHGRLESGLPVSEHHSGVWRHDPVNAMWIIGSEGTLRLDAMDAIHLGRRDGELEPVEVPLSQQRPWRVERDFIEAVLDVRRAGTWSASPDFHEGLRYMKKVEAIHRAAEQQAPVRIDAL